MANNDVIRPVAPSTGADEMVLASGQPQYAEVVVGKYAAYPNSEHGVLGEPVPLILYRFQPTDKQRRKIARGEDLYLSVMTFGRPPLPLQLQVGVGDYLHESPPIPGERASQRKPGGG